MTLQNQEVFKYCISVIEGGSITLLNTDNNWKVEDFLVHLKTFMKQTDIK